MTTNPTTEKILAEALELHEKGVSLHSIVRTYPEHKAEIEELFGAMATLSLEKEKVRVPKGGLERLLASLPEVEPVTPIREPIKSPFTAFMSSIQLSSLRFVLPIAALALLTGGIVLHKDGTNAPIALAPSTTSETVTVPATAQSGKTTAAAAAKQAAPAATPGAAAPMSMAMLAAPAPTNPTDRMVASFNQEAAQEATIAQENDAESAQAVSSQQAVQTDPTQ